MEYKLKKRIPWNKGKKTGELSEEHKKKLSLVLKGRKRSLEVVAKQIGRKMPKAFSELRRKVWMGNQIWKGRHHTEETKQKMRDRKNTSGWKPSLEQRLRWGQKGNKHWNWKGGISPMNKRIRESVEYKLWREAVFIRDNFTCIWCGKRGVYLEADHIKPFCHYPELRFSIDNGRTLCKECHSKTNTYRGRSNGVSSYTKNSGK